MSNFNSPKFGVIHQPKSFQELLEIIIEAPTDESYVRMWRGQADISWSIDSAAYRRLASLNKQVKERNIISYEESLLTQATHHGYRSMNGQELSDLELLARLQHHGAATQLLDTTRSVFVALWFSVSSQIDSAGALIGIHSDYLGGYESLPEKKPYREIMEEIKKLNHPITWEPTNVSPRIAAQHSQFLYSKVSESPAGSLCLPEKEDGTLIVAISSELKKIAKKILISTFDIHTKTLFPDLDGFCVANSYQIARWDMYRW